MSNEMMKPESRLTPRFGGKAMEWAAPARPAPLEERTAPVVEALAPTLAPPTQGFRKGVRGKDHLFAEYPALVRRAGDLVCNGGEFLSEVVRSNLRFRGVPHHQEWEEKTVRSLRTRLDEHLRLPPAEPLARLALGGEMEVWQEMQTRLRATTTFAVQALFTALDQMRALEWVGAIEWLGPDVAAFHFYEWIVTDTTVASRTTATATTTTQEMDILRTLRHAMHYHEVRKASGRAATDASVPRPGRVDRLVKKIPTTLLPFARVVTGDEIFRRAMERELHSELRTEVQRTEVRQIVNDWDPALVLGDYVLTGWDKSELPQAPGGARPGRWAVGWFCFGLLYVLTGLGLRAGLPHWGAAGRSLYAVLFPAHALAAVLLRLLGIVLRAAGRLLTTRSKFFG